MAERKVVRPVEWLAGILKMCLSGFINRVRRDEKSGILR